VSALAPGYRVAEPGRLDHRDLVTRLLVVDAVT
jgi:hypothetical protein